MDVFLAELRKLATQFGGMTERGLVCAFIAGLPEHAENLLQATTRVDDLPISEILARAQAILKDSLTGTESAAAAAQLPGCQEKRATALRRCYVCQEPNHMARDCPRRRGSPRSLKTLICYRCKRQGHVASGRNGGRLLGGATQARDSVRRYDGARSSLRIYCWVAGACGESSGHYLSRRLADI